MNQHFNDSRRKCKAACGHLCPHCAGDVGHHIPLLSALEAHSVVVLAPYGLTGTPIAMAIPKIAV